MVSNNNKNTNTNVNSDDDKINNNINIKIDLGDLVKQKPKPKKKTKPKAKPVDDMKSGATLNTASSTAPVKMGGAKMPSSDNKPNNDINNLLQLAILNAFNRNQNQPMAPPQLPYGYYSGNPTITDITQQQQGQQRQSALPPSQQQPALPPSQPQQTPSLWSSLSYPNPNPQFQQLQSGYTTTVSSPTTLAQQTALSSPILQSVKKQLAPLMIPSSAMNLQRYEELLMKGINISNEEGEELKRLDSTINKFDKERIQLNVNSVQGSLSPISLASQASALGLAVSRGGDLPPTPKTDWNDDLLKIYQENYLSNKFTNSEKKKFIEDISVDENVIKYADEVADYLLKTEPDLVSSLKPRLLSKEAERTGVGKNRILEKIRPLISAQKFPYFTVQYYTAPLNQMFYERVKMKILGTIAE